MDDSPTNGSTTGVIYNNVVHYLYLLELTVVRLQGRKDVDTHKRICLCF